jgi:excisionase family DNA binding protein
MEKTVLTTETDLIKLVRSCIREELAEFNANLPEPETKPVLFTRQETSELLGVSLVTLNAWEKNGVLIPTRIGTRVRYRAEDVEQAMNRKAA